MLGGGGPVGGCRLEGVSVDKAVVVARYTCPSGAAHVELRHPDDAAPSAPRTQKFSLAPSDAGRPPPELVDGVLGRLRSGEAGFRWTPAEWTDPETPSLSAAAAAGEGGRSRVVASVAAGVAGALACATAFFALLRLAGRSRAWPEVARRDPGAGARPALALAMAAFILLELFTPAPPVHPDTSRDFLMAGDCLAGMPCDRGPPTSLGPIVQGALWTRFVALGLRFGFGTAGVQVGVLVLLAASGAVVELAARRQLSPATSRWTAIAWVVLCAWVTGAPRLWNPSLLPLPLALFSAALLALVERGALLAAAGAGAALALAMDCHVVAALLVPVLAGAVAARAREPARAALASAASLAAVLGVDSSNAWRINVATTAAGGAWVPIGLVVVTGMVGGHLVRERLASRSAGSRAAFFLGAAAALGAGATAAGAVWGDATWPVRYLAPALPGLAAICAISMAAIPWPRRGSRTGPARWP